MPATKVLEIEKSSEDFDKFIEPLVWIYKNVVQSKPTAPKCKQALNLLAAIAEQGFSVDDPQEQRIIKERLEVLGQEIDNLKKQVLEGKDTSELRKSMNEKMFFPLSILLKRYKKESRVFVVLEEELKEANV